MPIKRNKFPKPKTTVPGGRSFARIRRAWVVTWSEGKKGFSQHEDVLLSESELEAITEASELSGIAENDVEVE